MRFLTSRVFCLAALLSIQVSSNAQTDTRPYITQSIGTGTLSCGLLIEAKERDNKAQLELFVQWAWGYLSAYNQRARFGKAFKRPFSGELRDLPDHPSTLQFLVRHCQQNPLDSVTVATESLLVALGGDLAGAKSPK